MDDTDRLDSDHVDEYQGCEYNPDSLFTKTADFERASRTTGAKRLPLKDLYKPADFAATHKG